MHMPKALKSPMDTNELLRLMVLNEISDDYENVDQIIFPNVARQCAKLGLVIQRPQIVQALSELVNDDFAKAYLLSAKEPIRELKRMPALRRIEKSFRTYFYATRKGLDLHVHDDPSWPFDDEGELRLKAE